MNFAFRVALAGVLGLAVSAFASPAMADGPKSPPIGPEAKARLDALMAEFFGTKLLAESAVRSSNLWPTA